MGDLLERNDVFNSFSAVREFLQAGSLNPIQQNYIYCFVNVNSPFTYTDYFEFECRDFLDNESYILYSDTFKANGFYRPVWSAYNLFSWDNISQELSVTLNSKTFKLKHVK